MQADFRIRASLPGLSAWARRTVAAAAEMATRSVRRQSKGNRKRIQE